MKAIIAVLLIIPSICFGKSLGDFFDENPDLNANPFTKNAITTQAGVATLNDVSLQKKPGEMSGQVMRRLLKENGYNYARVAVRQLVQQCNAGVAESTSQLKAEDCALIISSGK